MTVTWLTTIADIVNIVVIVKNIQSRNEYNVVVGPNERTVEVVVDPGTYNVTVVVFDICKRNYSSMSHVHVEETTSPSHFPTPMSRHTMSSPHMLSFDTPEPSCIQGNAGKGMSYSSHVKITYSCCNQPQILKQLLHCRVHF